MTEEVNQIFEKELGENYSRNVLLRDYASLKVGGVADHFYIADSIAELVGAVTLAYKHRVPYLVIGGGYNIVPSDSGFPGLVIVNRSANILFSPDFSTVIVDSGVALSKMVNLAAGRDLGGLEFLFGVPGTVGGAIYGNAGAFGYAIGDFVKSLTLLVPQDGEMQVVKESPANMNFSYRSTRLKEDYQEELFKPVILTATIQLVRRRKDEILRMMHDNLVAKKKSQPLNEVSAGSFFKNSGDTKENAAGYLLERAGAKKLRHGGAAFSSKHANFLINKKNATANDIRCLAEEAKELVRAKYNIDLDEEVEYIGKW